MEANVAKQELSQEQIAKIETAFQAKISERDGLVNVYEGIINSELTPELCNDAKALRLKLVKVRTGIAEIHKSQKAYFLAAGKFVDAWKNKETLPVKEMEAKLSEIETYFIRLEAERIQCIKDKRASELLAVDFDGSGMDLGNMKDDAYNLLLKGAKAEYAAKVEAERKAEELRMELERKTKLKRDRIYKTSRLAEFIPDYDNLNFGEMPDETYGDLVNDAIKARKAKEVEDERIRKENDRLKKEAEAEKKRLAKIEAERLAKEVKERKEREAKLAAERKAAAEKLAKEQAAKAKIEAELQAKKEAEARAEAERLAEEKRAKAAPDKEKALAYLSEIVAIGLPDIKDSHIEELVYELHEKIHYMCKDLENCLNRY